MPFSPDEFKATAFPDDIALPCNFMMRIPTDSLGADFKDLEYLSFLCNQTVIPGRHFSTNEYTTHGPIQRMPYQSIYDQLEVSIFCRSDLLERKFFDHWQNRIQSDKDYKWNYFKSYVQDLELWYFTRSIPAFHGPMPPMDPNAPVTDQESQSMISHKVKFIDAYPLQVQPLALDWGNKDAILNLPVTFSYTKWQTLETNYEHRPGHGDGTLQDDGPGLSDVLGWASDTLDLIDMYTGSIPTWVKQGQQISGIGRSMSGVINEGSNLFGPLKR
jgi:hypothetical protein